jgi:predicted enzyme related to lactoylglutathione lyase
MIDHTTHIPLLVRDPEKALEFYVGQLGFEKRQDYGKGAKRWLTIAPPDSDVEFALTAGEYTVDPRSQAGVHFTLTTSDCRREVQTLKGRGITFGEPEPLEMPYGLLATFEDPDGNRFRLLQQA